MNKMPRKVWKRKKFCPGKPQSGFCMNPGPERGSMIYR